MLLDEIESTKDFKVPKDAIDRIIGQDHAIEKVKIAVKQRRNLLLVGPPGVGKSMLAQALAAHLPKPMQEISVLFNPDNSNQPLVEMRSKNELKREREKEKGSKGKVVSPLDVPTFVAVRLGYRCSGCGSQSSVEVNVCPNCGAHKYANLASKPPQNPIDSMLTEILDLNDIRPETEVQTEVTRNDGRQELRVYQRIDDKSVRVLNEEQVKKLKEEDKNKRNVIVPVGRDNFVHMSGASEVELLGDVRHDPYGMHPEIGTPAHLRVVAGAIHEAHEGVLFVDELPHLENLQNYILTAMQEKKFPITGRNPQSAGASVKVKNVPCDFLFVGACNIKDVSKILPPLRSRIVGNGYEILLETVMADNDVNRDKILQFIAQEIELDGRIPHARPEVVKEVIKEAKRRAMSLDSMKNSLTLRLRELGGIVRLAGDLAVAYDCDYIEAEHVERALKESKSIERQLHDRYGSVWRGLDKDNTIMVDKGSPDKSYG